MSKKLEGKAPEKEPTKSAPVDIQRPRSRDFAEHRDHVISDLAPQGARGLPAATERLLRKAWRKGGRS